MSDCRVPMPVYSKDLVEHEDDKDIPPIPEGWMAMYYSDASICTTDYSDMGHIETSISASRSNNKILNHQFAPKFGNALEVLVLIKEK